MSSLNTASPTLTCAGCSANSLSIIKLKRLNAITIGICILFGVGSLSFSAFIMRKYAKLKRTIGNLESRLETMNNQLNIMTDSDLEDELVSSSEETEDDAEAAVAGTEPETSASRRRRHTGRSKRVEHSSRKLEREIDHVLNATKQEISNVLKTQLNGSPPLYSSSDNGPNDSSSDQESSPLDYETPATSPTRNRTKKSISFSDETSLLISPETMEDNKSMEVMLLESHDGRKKICSKNELNYEKCPGNMKACIEFIKSLTILADTETDVNKKKELRTKAYSLAKTVVNDNPDSYLALKWIAITVGRILDYLSVNEKVKNGMEFKNYLDQAIRLNNTDYLLYYLRGRWTFKMCNLSWAERAGIRMFGPVPNVSLDDAFEDFLKAEELQKNKSKGNLLHLGKCYISKNQMSKAIECLKKAKELPTRSAEHLKDNEEIESLLKKYSSN